MENGAAGWVCSGPLSGTEPLLFYLRQCVPHVRLPSCDLIDCSKISSAKSPIVYEDVCYDAAIRNHGTRVVKLVLRGTKNEVLINSYLGGMKKPRLHRGTIKRCTKCTKMFLSGMTKFRIVQFIKSCSEEQKDVCQNGQMCHTCLSAPSAIAKCNIVQLSSSKEKAKGDC